MSTTSIGSSTPSTASSSSTGSSSSSGSSTATGAASAAPTSSLPFGSDAGTSAPTTGLITDASIGSGINVDALVSQLVSAAAAPGESQIQTEQAGYTTQLGAIGALQQALTTFQTAVQGLSTTSAFTAHSATSSSPSVFGASASSTATPGSYSVQVTQLAQAAQLSSAAITGGGTAYVGQGTLTLSLGSSSFNVTVDSTNDTLDGLVSAINSATNNPGITASDVTTSTGSVLFLSSASTGAANAITVSSSGGDGGRAQFDFTPGATCGQGLTQLQAAQDANVTIAGLNLTSPTNTFTNALPGISLNLLTTSPSTTSTVNGTTTTTYTPQTLTIANDPTTTTTQVNAFVSAYNALQTEMASLGSYNASTSTAGPLLGDPLLSNLENQINQSLYSTVSGATGSLNSLASIGITPDTTGQLQVDSTKLQNALTTNYNAVGQIFGSSTGVAATLATTLSNVLGPSGAIQSRTNTLNSEMTQSQTALSTLDQQMAVLQSTYLAQFTALNTILADTQQTASFLTTNLAGYSSAVTADSLA